MSVFLAADDVKNINNWNKWDGKDLISVPLYYSTDKKDGADVITVWEFHVDRSMIGKCYLFIENDVNNPGPYDYLRAYASS